MTVTNAVRPRITIAIPTVNRAALLDRALRSALSQRAHGIEIIVSDNGSTDSTQTVLEKFSDPRLRVFRHEVTMPADVHGNFLVDQARGTYFLGLSDDDYLEPEFVDRVLGVLETSSTLSFAYTGCWVHYDNVRVPSLCGPPVESGEQFLKAFFDGRREVCWCACVTRLDELRSIGPIPRDRIFGDMFYWTKLAFQGDVGCVPTPLSNYTFMHENLSSAVPIQAWARETRMIADEVLAALWNCNLQPSFVDALKKQCKRFVARSTANQFVWNAIRQRSRMDMLGDLPSAVQYLASEPTVWPRLAAAMLLGRTALRRLVVHAAAERSRSRSSRIDENRNAH